MSAEKVLSLHIEKLAAGGEGLAFDSGRAFFVPLALPGEDVLAELVQERGDYARARLVQLCTSSASRIRAVCPLYAQCGGCNLQHLDYQAQLEEKALMVAETFRRVGGIDLPGLKVQASKPFAYRNRMQLHLSARGSPGQMRRASTDIVETPGCPVAVESIQDWIEERAGSSRARDELRDFILGKDRFIVFGHGSELWLEGRHGEIGIRVAGQDIRFHIKGFFQSNLSMLERFVPEVVAGLSGERAADLYCGVGLFGRFLKPSFKSVVCVENNPFALALARKNLPGSSNEFYASTVEDWAVGEGLNKRFDCILVDPPRNGLSDALRSWLLAAKPAVIVYVSCDFATLARDAARLIRGGYRMEGPRVFDFYPQTAQVESHARFIRE